MAVLHELLSIKTFREGKAESSVRTQRQVLAEAMSLRDQAQVHLEEFTSFAQRRERELFEDLCRRVVVVREILDTHAQVGEMKAQALHYQSHLDQAQVRCEQEDAALQERKQVHAQATRVKEKFIELVRLHAAEEWTALERKEDAELEEVAETRRDRADFGADEEAQP